MRYQEETNKEYDIVIRTRPDLNFFNDINKEEIFDSIENNCIYMRRNCEVFKDACDKIVNDCFAFGPPEQMSVYSRIYSSLKTLNSNEIIWHGTNPLGKTISPENTFRRYLLKNNLALKSSSIRHNVKRDNE